MHFILLLIALFVCKFILIQGANKVVVVVVVLQCHWQRVGTSCTEASRSYPARNCPETSQPKRTLGQSNKT